MFGQILAAPLPQHINTFAVSILQPLWGNMEEKKSVFTFIAWVDSSIDKYIYECHRYNPSLLYCLNIVIVNKCMYPTLIYLINYR